MNVLPFRRCLAHPLDVARVVAAEFPGCDPLDLCRRAPNGRRSSRERMVLMYMLVQFYPRPEATLVRPKDGRAPYMRRPAENEGTTNAVARALGVYRNSVQNACRRVEEWRDADSAFDAALNRIEDTLTAW